MTTKHKLLTITEWYNLKQLLDVFDIVPVQTEGARIHSYYLPFFGSAPSDAQAMVFEKRKDFAASFIVFERYKTKTPGLEVAVDIIHEAAHIITQDVTLDEDKGVAQLELALSRRVSDRMFVNLVKIHNEVYTWDVPYEELIQTTGWGKGNARAMRSIAGAIIYPWNTVRDQRREIMNVLRRKKRA